MSSNPNPRRCHIAVRNRFAVVFPLLFFQTRLGSSFKFASNLSFLDFFGAAGKFPLYCLEKICNISTGNYNEKRERILYPYSTFHTNGPSRLRTSPFYQ